MIMDGTTATSVSSCSAGMAAGFGAGGIDVIAEKHPRTLVVGGDTSPRVFYDGFTRFRGTPAAISSPGHTEFIRQRHVGVC
jgi:hypothetical protein